MHSTDRRALHPCAFEVTEVSCDDSHLVRDCYAGDLQVDRIGVKSAPPASSRRAGISERRGSIKGKHAILEKEPKNPLR